MTVLIAGAGIAGLTLGLTLHQIGVPFRIFESVSRLRPLGVGINLQPNATRELIDLGLGEALDQIGVRTRQYGFYSKLGLPIWEEPRGLAAGYDWPQISVHRGRLQMLLLKTLQERAGPAAVRMGAPAVGYSQTADQVSLHLADGQAQGSVLIACDGIHSAIRARMYPREGAPLWSGAGNGPSRVQHHCRSRQRPDRTQPDTGLPDHGGTAPVITAQVLYSGHRCHAAAPEAITGTTTEGHAQSPAFSGTYPFGAVRPSPQP